VKLRAVALWAVSILALEGCTRTVYYAVIAPRPVVEAGSGCFGQCQLLRAAGTKQYLNCLNACPDARIVREARCTEVQFDPNQSACTTEHNQTFSPVVPVVLILTALLLLVIGAAASSGSNSQTP